MKITKVLVGLRIMSSLLTPHSVIADVNDPLSEYLNSELNTPSVTDKYYSDLQTSFEQVTINFDNDEQVGLDNPLGVQIDKDLPHSLVIPIANIKGPYAKALLALGATGILMAFDQDIMDVAQDNRNKTTEVLSDFGDHMGSDYLVAGVAGAYALGLVFKDKKLRSTAVEAVESAVLGQLVASLAKSLVHRERPKADLGPYSFDNPGEFRADNSSFISGHSTGAWSVAIVFAKKYSDTKIVPIVAYSIATLVSLSRVHDRKHWASDVFLGAAVGYAAGVMTVNYNDKRRKRLEVTADIRSNYNGVMMEFRFGAQDNAESDLRFDQGRDESSVDALDKFLN